jgi:O-acetyl-ADP-ribose deacetylase (regulator of RNase III)
MTIQIIDGCIFEAFDSGEIDFLFHCCNMQNNFGAGIAKEIKERYPRAYDADTQWYQHKSSKFYSIGVVHFEYPLRLGAVFNLYGQEYYGKYGEWYKVSGRQLSYEYLGEALLQAAEQIPRDRIIGIPYGMGCGLAGGNWGNVLGLIELHLLQHQVKIYRK